MQRQILGGMCLCLGLFVVAEGYAQQAELWKPTTCEQMRAVAIQQAQLLHQDFMVTQGKLAEARVEIEELKKAIVKKPMAAPDEIMQKPEGEQSQ